MNANQIPSGTKYPQAMLDQVPRYEKQVFSRKAKIWRPTKKRKKGKFL